jgi:hypothetical protein
MKTVSLPSLALVSLAMIATASLASAQTIHVSASPTTITNQGDESTITLTVSPPSFKNLKINFVMTGTAGLGSDYALIGDFSKAAQVLIPAGQSTATVTLHAFGDDDAFPKETAVFNLLGGSGYRVGSPSQVQITIRNAPLY